MSKKNKILFFSLIIFILNTAQTIAQTLPIVSSQNNEVWYYVKFKNGEAVLQDMGTNSNLLTKKAVDKLNGQLWKITGTTNAYILTSKDGRSITYNTSVSRFQCVSGASTTFKLVSTTNSTYKPAWELQRNGSSQFMNQYGGAGVDKQLGEWSFADPNNSLEFVTPANMRFPQPLPDKLTEVPLSGKSEAPTQKLALWYRYPSTNWMTSSLPIGNGRFGAMIFGGVKQDEIQFNDKTLWSGSTTKYGAYQNFGSIFINNNNVEEAINYRRELDIENAICRVSYTNKGIKYLREYFASHVDSVIIVRLTASAANQISFDLKMWDAHACTPTYNGNSVTVNGKLDLVSYYARLTILNEGGTVNSTDSEIKVQNASTVTIILAGSTDYDPLATNYIKNTAELPSNIDAMIHRAAAKPYETLKTAHTADYKSLFDRVKLDLKGTSNAIPTNELTKNYNSSVKSGGKGIPFLEMLYFHYGRYLMISSSRGIAQPTNLQGIWNNSNEPPWSSDIHSNINVQMNYWPAENTNLSELHQPFLNYIYNEAMLHPQWRKNALDAKKSIASKLGLATPSSAKGWTLYTENNIFGFGSTFAMNYVVANAWFCMHSWQHYRYSLDEDFLLNNAYPVMKSCSEFWLERLIYDRGKVAGSNILKNYTPDGTLVAPLEYSPEHGPGEEDGTAHAQQLCWDLFNNTLKAMEVLGDKVAVDAAFKTQLQQAFSKLDPGTSIDKDGHLREWKYSEKEAGQTEHRHTSHLMGLFPGNQISPKINKPIFDAAIKTLNARGDEGTGWSMGWRINLWARSGDAERAHKLLRGAMNLTYDTGNGGGWGGGIYENLLDAHTPFQIDGNFGATSGIAEMLLQSHTDTIDILPTLPSSWFSGNVTGLRTVGNFEVDIAWENTKATTIRILSNKGQECKLSYPFIKNAKFTDKNGLEFSPVFINSNCAIFPTIEGGEYFLIFESKLENPEIAITSTINGGISSNAKSITANIGDNVILKSIASVAGQRYWVGPDNLKTSGNDVILNAIKTYKSGKYYIIFIGTEGYVSKDSIEINVNGAGPFVNVNIPGIIETQNYDFGGENIAFHALDNINSGQYLRNDGIDVYNNENRNYISLNNGEWVRYTFNSTRNAKYRISLLARPSTTNSTLDILFDGVLFKSFTTNAASSIFQSFSIPELAPLSIGLHTVTLKSTATMDVCKVDIDHFYTSNTLPDGLYLFRANDKYWTYSNSLTDKTKPTFQTKNATNNQIWEIKKDGTRYKMTTKTGERYINEQNTFGTNVYYSTWNTYNIYSDGQKHSFQNGGNSGTEYWKFDGTNISKTADPGYPINFDFELIPANTTSIQKITSTDIKIQNSNNQITVFANDEITDLKLYSITGSIIARSLGNTLNTSNLLTGIYFLAISMEKTQATIQKIIIK